MSSYGRFAAEGGLIAFLHRDENDYLKLFELGIAAPAEVTVENQAPAQGAAAPYACQLTTAALAAGPVVCPPVDERLLATYFFHYVSTGFLPAPPGPGRSTPGSAAGSDLVAESRLSPYHRLEADLETLTSAPRRRPTHAAATRQSGHRQHEPRRAAPGPRRALLRRPQIRRVAPRIPSSATGATGET